MKISLHVILFLGPPPYGIGVDYFASEDLTSLGAAARIASNTAKVNKYYLDRNLPLPSFDHNGPTKSLIRSEDADIEAARQAVIFDCS